MAYRDDPDLEFLKDVSNGDIDTLVNYLIKDEDGDTRLTEELTQSDVYKRNYPNHHAYWREIAAELQCFGANSFMTIFRGGKGVLYKELLCDVCDKMDVNYNSKASVETIEMNLLMKVLTDSMANMSTEDLKEIVEDLNLKTTNITPEAITAAIQAGIRFSGFLFYKIALIVANAVAKFILGRGLSLAANAALTRTIGIFAGPIGLIITGLWTALDIAGPAYRVTVPAVIQVAFLRAKMKYAN